MTDTRHEDQPAAPSGRMIPKVITGISGFDEISGGGLPRARLTAIVGSAGAGKTVFALQTIINRLTQLGEPCIFVTFEEAISRIRDNAGSFDWPADALDSRLFRFVDARIPGEAVVTGAFDIEGLLAGLTALVAEIGARNIVFDGVDMLLSSLQDERLERQELLRLDTWIRDAEISAIVTVKTFGSGDRDQIRADFLLYMTDCLVVLVDTVTATGASRTIRIGKYRGSGFSASPTPFVIGRSGFDVVAFKSARIGYPTFSDRVSSGVVRLDALLNGGYRRGSSTLISGSPGTSKSSLAASFIAAACARGDRGLLVSFDESASQIISNMSSIGIDLAPFVEAGLLTMSSFLSGGRSPEEHFIEIRNLLKSERPDCLVIDPISAFLKADYPFSALICENLLDMPKAAGITVLCTSLLDHTTSALERSSSLVSTIADTWIHVSYVARDGERNRAITIIKSRGIGHSNQVRELVLDANGINLVDVYVAEGEVLMGSARAQKEAEVERLEVLDQIATERQRLNLERQLAEARAQMDSAALELGWKQREADLLALAERSRREVHRVAAIERLGLRRARDDEPPVDPALPPAFAQSTDNAAG